MRARTAVLGIASLGIAACSLLLPYDDARLTPAGDGGDEASADGDTTGEACVLARWPDRPDAADSPDSGADLVLVARSVDLGLGDGGPVEGFDLDGVCTCPGRGSCTSDDDRCDGDGGSDRGGNDLFVRLSVYGKFVDQAQINGFLTAGRFSFLLGIAGYDGTPNDSHVAVSFFASPGTPIVDGGNVVPRFDGTDEWKYAESSLVSDGGPPYLSRYVDPDAYVANGVLVARFTFPLTVPSQGRTITIDLHDGVIVAPLVHDGARWKVGFGRLAGRWPRNDLLATIAQAKDPLGPGNLCGDSGTYQSLKPQLCGGADISGSTATDNTNGACDALALVVAFDAVDTAATGIGKLPDADSGSPCGVGYRDTCP